MPTAHAMRSVARCAVLIACAAPATKRATKTAVHQTPLRRPPRRSTADCSPTSPAAATSSPISASTSRCSPPAARAPRKRSSTCSASLPRRTQASCPSSAAPRCRHRRTVRWVPQGDRAVHGQSRDLPRAWLDRVSLDCFWRARGGSRGGSRVLPSHPASPRRGDPAGFPVHLDPGRREPRSARSGVCRHAARRIAVLRRALTQGESMRPARR